MKTSIIISTVAAVCLMITNAESPMNRNAQFDTKNLYSNILYIPSNASATAEVSRNAITIENTEARTKISANNNFSYLKFNVADYSDADNRLTDANAENLFEYLKFDSNNYDKNHELTSTELKERTLHKFDYLKFDANNYTATDNDETIETPLNEFDYLKFDVNNYTATDNVETIETPANEFEYLKFNVNDYSANENDESIETPVNEFDYLKFDVNKYSSTDLSTGQNVELPVAER